MRSHFCLLSTIKAGPSRIILFLRHGRRQSLCAQSFPVRRRRPWEFINFMVLLRSNTLKPSEIIVLGSTVDLVNTMLSPRKMGE
ncbi:hypothetical protein TNCV_467361 [Trichonephila clavipes]|nr:hypothetical protein TNCV_467361 [Trichonephila clavipes]